ncbi:MAG: hypothetical protein C4306_04495 [Thermoleophilia bacterium]
MAIAAAPVPRLKADQAGSLPASALVDLDEEATELARLGRRALDLGQDARRVGSRHSSQKRLALLARQELDQERRRRRTEPAAA